jgi:hypothetical protein
MADTNDSYIGGKLQLRVPLSEPDAGRDLASRLTDLDAQITTDRRGALSGSTEATADAGDDWYVVTEADR